MLLIQSENKDTSTNELIEWAYYYDLKILRFNEYEQINFHCLHLSNENKFIELSNSKTVLNTRTIKGYIYRRSGFVLNNTMLLPETTLINNKINKFLTIEYKKLHSAINFFLEHEIQSFGSFTNFEVNKLNVLQQCTIVGIDIPETIVTSYKSFVIDFFNCHKKIITKGIGESIRFVDSGFSIYAGTKLVDSNDIDILPNKFPPTLFQKLIDKKYDIRVFYIYGIFFSMAIMSQKNPKTKIDFRNYDYENPNRRIPYKLPIIIEEKIHSLMTILNLNTGSIDLVFDGNKFIFLEVNPVGQFSMTSKPCNYFLERLIIEKIYSNE